MKKYILLAVTSLGFSALFSNMLSAQFVQVEVKPAAILEVYQPENYLPELAELISIHTAQEKITTLRKAYSRAESTLNQKKLADARYNAMETCNINLLAQFYENPQEAWKNITQEYDNQELEMTLSLLNATPKKLHTGEEIRSEQMAHWYLGREVLTSLYATPEKYGTLKNGKSFPLWKDQEYVYNEEVNSFIQKFNSLIGRTGKIPGVTSQNSYQENEKAFNTYLKGLPQKDLSKIPESFKTFPKPPNALPPANELILMMDDPTQSKSVFPKWPDPWKKFVETNFQSYNPNGEMAEFFQSKSLVPKDEYRHKPTDEKNNRLNVYQGLKKTKQTADTNYQLALEFQQETIDNISNDLKELQITEKFDIQDVKSIDLVQAQLIEKKKKYISSIREKITKNQENAPKVTLTKDSDFLKDFALLPYSEQVAQITNLERGSAEYVKANNILNATQTLEHLNYINALEKDIEGELILGTTNSTNVDHLKKEKEAEKALYEELALEEEKELQKEYEKKIDQMCLNGGV